MKPVELLERVPDRPEEHPLHSRIRVSGEEVGARAGGPDEQLPAKLVGRPAEHRREHVRDHRVSRGRVLRDVAPHRHECVGEPFGILPRRAKVIAEAPPGVAERLRRRVVRRGQPPVGQTRHAAHAGLRPPAPEPERRAAGLQRRGKQLHSFRRVEGSLERLTARAKQRAKRLHGFLEPGPPLLPRQSDGAIVPLGGAGTQPDHEPPTGQPVDRGQRLGKWTRTAHDRERDRRPDGHVAGGGQHRREGHESVEPRFRVHEVVVRGEPPETEPVGGARVLREARERSGFRVRPRHQGQVRAELHPVGPPRLRKARNKAASSAAGIPINAANKIRRTYSLPCS